MYILLITETHHLQSVIERLILLSFVFIFFGVGMILGAGMQLRPYD